MFDFTRKLRTKKNSSKVDFFSHSSSQIGPWLVLTSFSRDFEIYCKNCPKSAKTSHGPIWDELCEKNISTLDEKDFFWPTIRYSSKTYFIFKAFCKRSSAQSSGKRHHKTVPGYIGPFWYTYRCQILGGLDILQNL